MMQTLHLQPPIRGMVMHEAVRQAWCVATAHRARAGSAWVLCRGLRVSGQNLTRLRRTPVTAASEGEHYRTLSERHTVSGVCVASSLARANSLAVWGWVG